MVLVAAVFLAVVVFLAAVFLAVVVFLAAVFFAAVAVFLAAVAVSSTLAFVASVTVSRVSWTASVMGVVFSVMRVPLLWLSSASCCWAEFSVWKAA